MYPAVDGDPVVLANGLDSSTNITHTDRALYVSIGQGTPGRRTIGPTGSTFITGESHRIELG